MLTLVAASPMLGVVMPMGNSERFSEFWLLGPDHLAEDYPFTVGVGEVYSVFIGVGNHMENSEYYMVHMKFSNSTKFLPDILDGVPSSLPNLYDFRFFAGDDEACESAVTFEFEDVTIEDDTVVVGSIAINGVSLPVVASADWDSENQGYFFELFFELWRYDVESDDFMFDNRYVGLRLNITAS